MGQDVDAFEDHLVGVFIAVVAALAEDGDPLEGDGQAVFLGHDLGHEQAPLQGPGVEQGLGQAVADGRVEPLALDFQGFEFPGHGPEGADRPPLQARPDVPLQEGNVVGGQEERIAPARAGVLDGSAIAHGDAAVFQEKIDGHALPGLPDAGEAGRHGRSLVDEAVVVGALLDGPLVVEEERRCARREYGFEDFHRGLPINLPLLMA